VKRLYVMLNYHHVDGVVVQFDSELNFTKEIL